MLSWCAIGDSFTYLNDHLDETGHFVTRGYLDRIGDKLRPQGVASAVYSRLEPFSYLRLGKPARADLP